MDEAMSPISHPAAAVLRDGTRGRPQLDGEAVPAQGASGNVLTDEQSALLAGIEARLTKEVMGLVGSLAEFGRRAQAIGKEVPDDAQFCQLVPSFLALCSFQLAYALGKSADRRIFAEDGAEYLRELGLGVKDLFREIDLDGRRFLAVALVEQGAGQRLGGIKA